MRQPVRARALLAVSFAVVLVVPGAVRAQDHVDHDATMSAVPLPGGLAAARAALRQSEQTDGAHLLVDVVRQSYETPVGMKGLRRDAALGPLFSLFERSKSDHSPSPDVVPLPLTPAIWTSTIFGGKLQTGALVYDILRSPPASLMYCALLALDPATRQWFAENPSLLAEVSSRHAAAFLLAANGIRVANGAIAVPGGSGAVAVWQDLVGKPVRNPAEFIRALLAGNEGRLAYFYGAVAQLPTARGQVLLSVPAADAAGSAASARRMLTLFERVAVGWDYEDRPFWRPSLDPALLLSELAPDPGGRPIVPGTAKFWTLVFGDGDPARERDRIADGSPADFTWLCEQIFTGGQAVVRGPYHQVLFAARRVPRLTRDNAVDAVVAMRAVVRYPALIDTLERARVASIATYAAAARRAVQLSSIEDDRRASGALTQFQGALVVVTRALARGGLDEPRAGELIDSLIALDPGGGGEYDGAVVEWLSAAADPFRAASDAHLTDANGSAPRRDLDDSVRAMLSGASAPATSVVEWEGTRYRVDPASAESNRLGRLLSDAQPVFLASAESLVAASRALEAKGLTRDALARHAAAVQSALAEGVCDAEEPEPSELATQCRELQSALARSTRQGDVKAAARLAPRLRLLADALLARGLIDLTYAAALGQPDSAVILAADAASRHEFGFGLPGYGRLGPWRRPAAGADRVRDWHVTGSLLGLDIVLAPFALARVSARPPASRPSLNDEDRRVFTETIVLMEPSRLMPADQQAIVASMKRGRTRADAIRTVRDVEAAAADLHLGQTRRTLMAWAVSRGPASPLRFSPYELLLLGLEPGDRADRLGPWGAAAEPRLGCHCLQMPAPEQLDLLFGRWHTGVLATGFPDLNLRLVDMLSDLQMPGMLLPSVLAAATWDLVINARSRDLDDRQALVEFVDALTIDRVEQYLALLTTDGPLVPLAPGSAQQ